MKAALMSLSLVGLVLTAPTYAIQMDPNMPGMQHTQPSEVRAVGVIKAINTAQGTITLQHEAIPAIGWPAMTMPFHASPDVLKQAKVGAKVQFTLHPDGIRSVVTALSPSSVSGGK
ncbi:MAG TPA: copper-binding protein [Acidobacteriaceae bacterium]|nr:copper-binding protein [Acidobacteriaceae bacterium]